MTLPWRRGSPAVRAAAGRCPHAAGARAARGGTRAPPRCGDGSAVVQTVHELPEVDEEDLAAPDGHEEPGEDTRAGERPRVSSAPDLPADRPGVPGIDGEEGDKRHQVPRVTERHGMGEGE